MDYKMQFKVMITKIVVEIATETLYEIGEQRCINDDEASYLSGYVEGMTDVISMMFENSLVPGWEDGEDESFKRLVGLLNEHRDEIKNIAKMQFKFS